MFGLRFGLAPLPGLNNLTRAAAETIKNKNKNIDLRLDLYSALHKPAPTILFAPGRDGYKGSYTMRNVPSVSGPNLTSSNDTCMGSASGSANVPDIGLSFGSTYTDEQCKLVKMSRELWNKGMKAASLALDCMNPQAREALEITGTKCPQSMTAEERRAAYGPDASSKGAAPAAAPTLSNRRASR